MGLRRCEAASLKCAVWCHVGVRMGLCKTLHVSNEVASRSKEANPCLHVHTVHVHPFATAHTATGLKFNRCSAQSVAKIAVRTKKHATPLLQCKISQIECSTYLVLPEPMPLNGPNRPVRPTVAFRSCPRHFYLRVSFLAVGAKEERMQRRIPAAVVSRCKAITCYFDTH